MIPETWGRRSSAMARSVGNLSSGALHMSKVMRESEEFWDVLERSGMVLRVDETLIHRQSSVQLAWTRATCLVVYAFHELERIR